jgi:hypothetical protein
VWKNLLAGVIKMVRVSRDIHKYGCRGLTPHLHIYQHFRAGTVHLPASVAGGGESQNKMEIVIVIAGHEVQERLSPSQGITPL